MKTTEVSGNVRNAIIKTHRVGLKYGQKRKNVSQAEENNFLYKINTSSKDFRIGVPGYWDQFNNAAIRITNPKAKIDCLKKSQWMKLKYCVNSVTFIFLEYWFLSLWKTDFGSKEKEENRNDIWVSDRFMFYPFYLWISNVSNWGEIVFRFSEEVPGRDERVSPW